MRRLVLLTMHAGRLFCQPTVAPAPEQVGSTRGENEGDYNVVDSFEFGERFIAVGGDGATYRSQVNYSNGPRLLSSYLMVNSRDGHGKWFDTISLTTQGLGDDPYESATLRIEKNRLYRYDLLWRLNDYVNPGLASGGADEPHTMDTRYTWQDQDLTLFPDSRFKFFLGYSRGSESGPELSTVLQPGSNTQYEPIFAYVKVKRNEYRIGNEFRVWGIRVNWLRGWEDFREDTPYSLPGPSPQFSRSAPYHGANPYWRVALFSSRAWLSLNGRFTYTAGSGAFALNESSAIFGLNQASQQIISLGTASRPVATGNLNLVFAPFKRWSFTNSTSIYNVRTEGYSSYIQFDNNSLTSDFLSFQYLGIRTIANGSVLDFAATNWLSFAAGYHYSDRLISSILFAGMTPYGQTNILNSGTFDIRLRPIQPLTVTLTSEIGVANQPFAPAEDKNYHTLGGRVQYKRKNLIIEAVSKANYNVNSVSLSSFASHTRTYSASGSWTPLPRLAIDLSYTKLHVDTLAGVFYFAPQLIQNDYSYYVSNIHAANAGVRFAMTNRADLYLGYSRVQDTGDGRSTVGAGLYASTPELQAAQTYPLTYQSPMARISVRLVEKLLWNCGYQYYAFREQFYSRDGYHANTGYTSLLWSF